jgi:serine/threonine protein kinase
MIGKTFNDRYKIIEKLGSGGTAIVYRGQDLLLGRMVTIKILREEYGNNADFVRRFRHEAQAVASLSHGNIVGIYDVGIEDDMQFIVMEFVEGENLKDFIRRRGIVPTAEACNIINQVLAGIQHAHEHGIIHRDIKSHNILLSRDGQAKVTDFGIAVGMSDVTLTYNTSSRIMGSVHYISPEQVQGQPVTEKSDIYSAGVVLYEMLTGRLPFLGETPISIAMQHVQGELILPHQLNPKVSMGISYVVMRAMRKNPETRYSSAREMAEAVVAAYQGESEQVEYAEMTEEEPRLKKPLPLIKADRPRTARARVQPNSKRLILLGLGAAALVLVVLILVFLLGSGGGKATVPHVVGLDLEQALADFSDAGLPEPDIIYVSSNEDENIVVSQSVAGEQEVSKDRVITLRVSEGAGKVSIPNLVGSTRRLAELSLENRDIRYEVVEEYDDDVARDLVISHDPEAGAEVSRNTVVILTVSLGPEPQDIIMPDLRGKTMDEAAAMIAENNFNIVEIKYAESRQYAENQISEQSVAPDTRTQTGIDLVLTVSEGPGPKETNPNYSSHDLFYLVPNDGQEHHIILKLTDNYGAREVYNSRHDAGYYIEETITYFGSGALQIFDNGIVVSTEQLY